MSSTWTFDRQCGKPSLPGLEVLVRLLQSYFAVAVYIIFIGNISTTLTNSCPLFITHRLSKYNNFAVNEQMRTFLGHTEDKMVLARHHGSSDEIDKRLATLTGSTAPSIRTINVPSKTTVDKLPGELSGTALWQSAVQETTLRQYAGGRVKLALQKAKTLDLHRHLLQVCWEINSLFCILCCIHSMTLMSGHI